MNGLAGGLASTVVNFGMTGNATFNLASIKGFGLLEVTIGKDGISAGIGSGGMSLSFETLMSAARGRKEAGKVMDWKYGTDESRSTLNGINLLGYTNIQLNHDLAKNIWNEQIGVDYADIAGYGLYKVGEKSVTLNSDLLGGGLEESAKLATVLSHEGTHLYGNRIEGIAHFQGAATYTQLLDKFNLAGDKAFAGEIMAGLTSTNSWKVNTGDEDWWKQVRRNDGSFAWQEDGSLDFTFEDGTVVTAEEMKGFISRYLIKQQAQNQGVGVFSSYGTEPTNAEIAMTGVFADYLRNSSAIFPQQVVDKYAAFVVGTEAFADASIAVQNAMTAIDKGKSGEIINKQLNEMNFHLMKIQEGGYLVKNKVSQIDSSRILNQDGLSFPVALNTGDSYLRMTSAFGNQMLIQESDDSPYRWRTHKQVDIVNQNAGISNDLIATKDDLTFSLAYSENPWGLFYDIDWNNQDYQQLSHMNSSSIMNYLSLFGSEGVKLYDNKLYGVQKNMVLGKTGSTGLSTGIHLDFAQYNKAGKKIDPFEFHWNTLLNERIFLDDDFGFSLETDKFHFDVWNTMHNKAPQKVFKEYNKELLEITPNYGGFGT